VKESKIVVEEELPLKQGLKPMYLSSFFGSNSVEEELPLKQGLKQLENSLIGKDDYKLKRNFH